MAASCGVPLCHSPRGRLSIITLSVFLGSLVFLVFLALSTTTTTTSSTTKQLTSGSMVGMDFKKTVRETLAEKVLLTADTQLPQQQQQQSIFESMRAKETLAKADSLLGQRHSLQQEPLSKMFNVDAPQVRQNPGGFLGETPANGKENSMRQGTIQLPHPLPSTLHPRPTNSSLAKKQRYPKALIIGVRKGGTRALINMLKCHPDIAAALEEIHFYDRNENFKQGIRWYVRQMPPSTENQITIEKSPFYFVSPPTPKRIHDISPDIKIILIVRNPIDRAVSDYSQLTRKKSNRGSFEDFVFPSTSGEINTNCSPVSASCYDVHFRRWLKYFNLDQIHIVDGDALISNPGPEVKKVESFLGVGSYFKEDMFYFNATKGFYCWTKLDKHKRVVPDCLGSEKGHAMPQLSNHTVQRLVRFFKPHNERFFVQIGRRFNWDTKYRNTVYT